MNPMYTVEELEFMTKTTELKAMITFDGVIGNMEALVKRVDIPNMIITRVSDYIPGQGQATAESLGIKDKGWHHFGELLEATASHSRPRPTIKPEDPCVIQFTGGTTGAPKGATLTHANIVAGIYENMYWGGSVINPIPVERRKSFCVLPYYHIYGEVCQMCWSIKNAATQIHCPDLKSKKLWTPLRSLMISVILRQFPPCLMR